MKKIIAMLLALVMVLGLAACATKTEPAQPEETTPAETTDTPAAEEPTPAETETEEPAATEATGSVYYLNFKPEADEAWQKLAATYTEQTGVPVKVVTAASGTYDTTLAAELDKSSAPTLFQCGNQGAINSYGDYCYPLDGNLIKHETIDMGRDTDTLALSYSLLDHDALVFRNLNSTGVALCCRNNERKVHVEFEGNPTIMFWHHPDGQYLCIEPWNNSPDFVDAPHDIAKKPNFICLKPGREANRSHTITIL